MLKPDYLLHISEGAENIAEQLHIDIMERIIKRMMIRIGRGEEYLLTATDRWNIQVLQDAGYLLEEIQKLLADATKLQQQEIAEAFEEAGIKALDYDDEVYRTAGLSPVPLTQSPHLIRIMQRNYEATMGEWTNFTRTTAETAQQLFINECDKMYNLVSSGAVSYTESFLDAIKRIVNDGLTITYPTGHTDTIETATLRCVRTGISQMSGQITDARMEEMDWDIILTSSHLGARVTGRSDYSDHAWWQGKFYSRTGRDNRFPPYSVCGQGHVQGIHGANCRHSHGPGDGEHNPFERYDSEQNKTQYEIEQRQRAIERKIRRTKRQVMEAKAAVDACPDGSLKHDLDMLYQKKAALLKKQNDYYNEYCERHGQKRLQERLAIAKWDRQQAAAARGAAQRYENAKGN